MKNKEAVKCLRRAYTNLARSVNATADLAQVFRNQKDKREKVAQKATRLIMQVQQLLNVLAAHEDIDLMSEICPVCKIDLIPALKDSQNTHLACPNELAKIGPWCPIRYRYNNIGCVSYTTFRVLLYLIVMDDNYFHIKAQTGGCNEFDDPPIFIIKNIDTKSLFNFSDIDSIQNQIKMWLAFS